MSDEPTRQQQRPAPPAPRRRWHWSALLACGAVTGAGVLLATAAAADAAPWYVSALAAAGAVSGAITLRWSLRRPAPVFCGAAYWAGGEQMFICLRRAGHRGSHREGNVAWDEGGPYRWRGRRR